MSKILIIIGAIGFILIVYALCTKEVTVRFINPNTGKSRYTGHGHSVGEAITDGIKRMTDGLSSSSREETIENALSQMRCVLNDNKRRMSKESILACEEMISRTQRMLDARKKEKEDKLLLRQQQEENSAKKNEMRRHQKECELSARIETAGSLPALLSAIEKANLYRDSNSISSSSSNMVLIKNNSEHQIINAYIDHVFATINELSLQYVSLAEIKKKIATFDHSVTQCLDKLPLESQSHYHAELAKLLGEEAES